MEDIIYIPTPLSINPTEENDYMVFSEDFTFCERRYFGNGKWFETHFDSVDESLSVDPTEEEYTHWLKPIPASEYINQETQRLREALEKIASDPDYATYSDLLATAREALKQQ